MSDSDCMEEESEYMSESSWGDTDDECEFPDTLVEDSSMSDPFKTPRYVTLEPSDIVSEQQEAIQRVMEITSFPAHMARTFLQHKKWNLEKLTEDYYEDPEKALAKAGLAAKGDTEGAVLVAASVDADGDSVSCEVCFDEIHKDDLSRLMTVMSGCGHRFCNECWRHHLQTQIEEGQAVRIRCAGTTVVAGETTACNMILDDGVVERLLSDAEDKTVLEKYKRRLMDSYVNDNPRVKWCPGTDCCQAVRVTESFDPCSASLEVECAQGHEWCFVCSGEAHSPAWCGLVRSWKKKCADDSETSNWLQANTKDCPQCRIAINKDGGCNHMHCKQCDHHFCWVCLGPFDHASYNHTCNKFVEQDDKVNQSRAALERYMHHFTRFQTHAKSREMEAELRRTAVEKMSEMQDVGNKTYLEVQFLKEATSQLIQARRTLQWSYVVGYYQPAWLLRNIFENNQAELENSVEELSFMFESIADEMWALRQNTEVLDLCKDNQRVRLIDLTKKVGKRLEGMVANLEEMRADDDDAAVLAPSLEMEEVSLADDSAGTKPEGSKPEEHPGAGTREPVAGAPARRTRRRR